MNIPRPTTLQLAAVFTVVAIFGGCSGGCASWSSIFGGGGPDDSAEALAGSYSLVGVRRATSGCLGESGRDGDEGPVDGRARLEIVDAPGPSPAEADTAAGGASSNPALRLSICEDGARCEEPTWRVVFEKTEDGGWNYRAGASEVVEEETAARACRLAMTIYRAEPVDAGLRLRRRHREQVVSLEGDVACTPETAVGYGEQLDCASEVVYRAKPSGES